MLRLLYLLSQRGATYPEPPLTSRELHADQTLHVLHPMLESPSSSSAPFTSLIAVSAQDLAVIQYTGGTTGLPKGAMLTHRNLLVNAMQGRTWIPRAREGEEVMLCVIPFFHAYGMTVSMNFSLLAAATMVLIPRFKAKQVVKAIRDYHPSIFPGIPTLYLALMREVGKQTSDLRSIKFCISGAAPLPRQAQANFEAATGGQLVEGYGLSEAAPMTHGNPFTQECLCWLLGASVR